MNNWIEDFLNFKTIEHYSLENTIRSYRTALNKIYAFFEERNIDILSKDSSLIANSITELISYMKGKGLSNNTISLRLVCLKEFLKFLAIEGKIEGVPFFEYPKPERKLPVYLSCREVNKLLNTPSLTFKQKVVLEVLYATGMRVTELSNIKLGDIDMDKGLCKVFGKGEKERLIPIGLKALEAIKVYSEYTRPELARDESIDNLLLTRTGKIYRRKNLWELVKVSSKIAKLKKDISPHSLRHSVATHLLDNEADILYVQKLLGHSSLMTTQKYTHISMKHLKKAYKKYHPRASKANWKRAMKAMFLRQN